MKTDFYENKMQPSQAVQFWICDNCSSRQYYTHLVCTECGAGAPEVKAEEVKPEETKAEKVEAEQTEVEQTEVEDDADTDDN